MIDDHRRASALCRSAGADQRVRGHARCVPQSLVEADPFRSPCERPAGIGQQLLGHCWCETRPGAAGERSEARPLRPSACHSRRFQKRLRDRPDRACASGRRVEVLQRIAQRKEIPMAVHARSAGSTRSAADRQLGLHRLRLGNGRGAAAPRNVGGPTAHESPATCTRPPGACPP